jgi:type IV pilus assembly protein PilP
MMRRHSIAGIVGGILVFVLTGGIGAVGSLAAEAKAVPSTTQAVKAVSTVAPAAYVYRAAGKPDPFRPFIELDLALQKKKLEEQSKKASLKERPVSPLQQEDLWNFRLLGIAGEREGAAATAIVEDGTRKKYYPLFVGTYIGLNRGRVASILPDRVIVEEPTGAPAKRGGKTPLRRINLMLHKDQ